VQYFKQKGQHQHLLNLPRPAERIVAPRTDMTMNVVTFVVLPIFVIACVIAIGRLWVAQHKMDAEVDRFSKDPIVFRATVRAKVKKAIAYVALKGPCEILVRSQSIQVTLSSPFNRLVSGTNFVFQADKVSMSVGRHGFPPPRMRSCIILSGKQLRKTIYVAVYMPNGIMSLWDALLSVGVRPVSEPPGQGSSGQSEQIH
jgi:hypothetical protein